MTDARDEIVEKMAIARHNAWRDEWLSLSHKEPLPSWEEMQESARQAALRCERAALSAIEASGMKIMAREPTDEMTTAMIRAHDTFLARKSYLPEALLYRAAFDAAPVLGGKE